MASQEGDAASECGPSELASESGPSELEDELSTVSRFSISKKQLKQTIVRFQ